MPGGKKEDMAVVGQGENGMCEKERSHCCRTSQEKEDVTNACAGGMRAFLWKQEIERRHHFLHGF